MYMYIKLIIIIVLYKLCMFFIGNEIYFILCSFFYRKNGFGEDFFLGGKSVLVYY